MVASYCYYEKGPCNADTFGFIWVIGGSGLSCLFNIVQSLGGTLGQIVDAIIDFVTWLLDELGSGIGGIAGTGEIPGIAACFNIDCFVDFDPGPEPPIPPVVVV